MQPFDEMVNRNQKAEWSSTSGSSCPSEDTYRLHNTPQRSPGSSRGRSVTTSWTRLRRCAPQNASNNNVQHCLGTAAQTPTSVTISKQNWWCNSARRPARRLPLRALDNESRLQGFNGSRQDRQCDSTQLPAPRAKKVSGTSAGLDGTGTSTNGEAP